MMVRETDRIACRRLNGAKAATTRYFVDTTSGSMAFAEMVLTLLSTAKQRSHGVRARTGSLSAAAFSWCKTSAKRGSALCYRKLGLMVRKRHVWFCKTVSAVNSEGMKAEKKVVSEDCPRGEVEFLRAWAGDDDLAMVRRDLATIGR